MSWFVNRSNVVSALSCICSALLAVSTVPSQASENPYSPAYDHPYRHGAVPTREAHTAARSWARAQAKNAGVATATSPQTLSYAGGLQGAGVMNGKIQVFVVLFGSQWGSYATASDGAMTVSNDPAGGVPYLQRMFKSLGTGNETWSGTMTQYCDGAGVSQGATSCNTNVTRIPYPTGGTLAAVWYDNTRPAPDNASASDIANEAIAAAAHFGNTSAQQNRYAQYVIMFPPGTHPDGFNTVNGPFCAWHDYTGDTTYLPGVTSPYGNIAFINMPYVTDLGASCGASAVNPNSPVDAFSITASQVYAETLTDPYYGTGWINQTSDATFNGEENGMECAWITSGQGAMQNVLLGTQKFAMQSTWSNDTNRCEISHSSLCNGECPPPPCVITPVRSGTTTCAAAGLPNDEGTAYILSYSQYPGLPFCTPAPAGFDTSACIPIEQLSAGVPVKGISGAASSSHIYTIKVPAGRSVLSIKSSGGSGNADLYVQIGSDPTTSSYLKRSTGNGNGETLTVSHPASGIYHILVYGKAAYSGLTLIAID